MDRYKTWDVAVIGGGIVGLATAMALTESGRFSVIVLETEHQLATHQTGHNSGVIHSGLYYRPGSLKAQNCVAGRRALLRFCEEHGVAHELCGKVVVATHPNEIPALDELERRGRANGLEDLRRLDRDGIREIEPRTDGVAGLYVPQTGIVDFRAVSEAYARRVRERDGQIDLDRRLVGCVTGGRDLVLETTGDAVHCRRLVNCAGLQCDRVARMCGVDPGVRIVPFRGEYYELAPHSRGLVRNLIYPVPDPKYPFLGVHFTRMLDGSIEAGPNAVLAFRREGYTRWSISPRDMTGMLAYGGFWRMAARHWRTGIAEWHRSFSKGAFVRALQRLVPELVPDDVQPARSGVRAQAVDARGRLLDDFRIEQSQRTIHVLNAPSPAATASIAIGRTVATLAAESFDR